MERIKLMLEWVSPPLWYSNDDGEHYPMSVDNLPIGDKLRKDIKKWDMVFQSTYDQEDPNEIGFSSESADKLLNKSLEEEGHYLYLRLKEELLDLYLVTSIYE